MNWRKAFVAVAMAVAGVLFAGAQAQAGMLRKQGVLLVGSDTGFPPFESRALSGQGIDGYAGFDPDLVHAVAQQMGLKMKIDTIDFDGLLPAVQAGRVDMIMGALTITPKRAKNVAFSCPYINADLSILSRRKTGKLTAKDLKGKVIGGQLGTTGLAKAKAIPGTKTVKTYETAPDAINDLISGRIYAVVNDQPVNAYIVTKHPELITGQIFHSGAQYGFAFQKRNKALVKRFDKALAAVEADGRYAKIYHKWFGIQPRSIPSCN